MSCAKQYRLHFDDGSMIKLCTEQNSECKYFEDLGRGVDLYYARVYGRCKDGEWARRKTQKKSQNHR